MLVQNAPAQQDESILLYVASCWCSLSEKLFSYSYVSTAAARAAPPKKSQFKRYTYRALVDRYVDYWEERIGWLIATTASQTVPERDQALYNNKLVARIHQETLAVLGNCLYYVHARVSGCRRRWCSDNTAVSSRMNTRRTLSICMLNTLNICCKFCFVTKCDSYHTTAIILNSCSFLYVRTTTPPVKYNTI